MLKSSVTSAYIIDEANLEKSFETVKKAGFDCLDFNLDVFLGGDKINSGEFGGLFDKSIDEICEHFAPYKAVAEKFGVEFHQAHAPFQLYVDGRDDINEKCVEVVEKCLAVCKYVGCKYLVVHPVNLAKDHGREYEKKVNLAYYKQFIPAIKKYGVTVCLENMFSVVSRVVTEAVCSDCQEAAWYIDELNKAAGFEAFGFCLDLGHLTLLGKNIRVSINDLGSRIKILHLHDNDNISDNHAMPYSYARLWGMYTVTDWEGLLNGLHDIGYTGSVNFEIATGLRLLPKPVLPAALAYVAAVGKYFSDRILGV